MRCGFTVGGGGGDFPAPRHLEKARVRGRRWRLRLAPQKWRFYKRKFKILSLPLKRLLEPLSAFFLSLNLELKMPLLQGSTNWQPARRALSMRGPVELHCPPCRRPYAALCIDAHVPPAVNRVARLRASKFVLHRQVHAPQCIAHLLLTRRRVDRHPNKRLLDTIARVSLSGSVR